MTTQGELRRVIAELQELKDRFLFLEKILEQKELIIADQRKIIEYLSTPVCTYLPIDFSKGPTCEDKSG